MKLKTNSHQNFKFTYNKHNVMYRLLTEQYKPLSITHHCNRLNTYAR